MQKHASIIVEPEDSEDRPSGSYAAVRPKQDTSKSTDSSEFMISEGSVVPETRAQLRRRDLYYQAAVWGIASIVLIFGAIAFYWSARM